MTTTSIKPVASATSNAVAVIKPDQQVSMVKIWTEGFDKLTKTQAFALTPEERGFGTSLITGLVMKCTKEKIDTNKLDMTNFFEQTKHYAKLKLSFQEGEIYIDTRNNKNTDKIDIAVRKQYQGIMKLAARWIKNGMKIVNWHDEIVCEGDTFSYDFDFLTGEYRINYKKTPNIDHTNLQKITHAIAIAYIEISGRVRPYVSIIDKKRIMRAFNASSAKDKGPWNSDTDRMVRKTAYWCLYNDILKPFVDIPEDLQASFVATEDDMDFSTTTESADDTVYDMPIEETNDYTSVIETIEEPQDDFLAYLDAQDKEKQTDELVCANCGKKITEKVAQYSKDKFGKPLCLDCQKNT